MRSVLIIIILLTAFTFSIDCLWEGDGIDEVEVMGNVINNTRMKAFTDSTYGYCICYPEFFQPSEDNKDGCNRFAYHGRTDMLIETWVAPSIDKITKHANQIKQMKDCIIAEGNYYEEDKRYEGFMFHAKAFHSSKRWVVFMVVYNVRYSRAMERLINTIDAWKL